MKTLSALFCFTLFLNVLSAAESRASQWKVVAVTTNCPEKVQILAKEGEKFVKAVHNGQEEKLFAQNGAAFSGDAPKTTFFKGSTENKDAGDMTLSFTQPGMVESNLPKLDLAMNGKKHHCHMKSK